MRDSCPQRDSKEMQKDFHLQTKSLQTVSLRNLTSIPRIKVRSTYILLWVTGNFMSQDLVQHSIYDKDHGGIRYHKLRALKL